LRGSQTLRHRVTKFFAADDPLLRTVNGNSLGAACRVALEHLNAAKCSADSRPRIFIQGR
jgi:hypothetical protein